MGATFFSPTKQVTGGVLEVKFHSKDAAIYFNLVKQVSWDESKRLGNFKGGTKISVKLSADEAGSLIETIRNKGQYSFFHSFGEEKTTGSLRYYFIEASKKEGFGLTVKKGETEIKIGLTLGSAERLMEYLKFALDHIFSADYSADKKRFEEAQKQKTASKSSAEENADDNESW